MVIATEISESFEITTVADKLGPPEHRTTFLARDLTETERAEVADSVHEQVNDFESQEIAVRTLQGTKTAKILRRALIGTEPSFPLRDGKLNPVPFEADLSGQVTDGYLRRIPWNTQLEVAERIWERAFLSAELVKKPAPSPTTSSTPNSPGAASSAGADPAKGIPETDAPQTPSA